MLFELGLFLGITAVLLVVIKLTVTGQAPEQKTSIQENNTPQNKESEEPAKPKVNQQQPKTTSKKPTKTKNNKTKPKKQQSETVKEVDIDDEETPILEETQPFEAPSDPTRGKSRKAKSDKNNQEEQQKEEEEEEEEEEELEQEDFDDFMSEDTDGWNVVGGTKPKKTNEMKKSKSKTENKKSEKKSKKQEKKKQAKKQKSDKTETEPSVNSGNGSQALLTEDGEAPLPIKPIYSSAEEFWRSPKRKPQPQPKTKTNAQTTSKTKKSEKSSNKKKTSTKKANRVVQPNKMEVSLTARGWGKAPQSTSVSLDGEFPSLAESKDYVHKKERSKKDAVGTSSIDQDGLHSQEGSDGEDEEIASVETPEANGTLEDKGEIEEEESEEEDEDEDEDEDEEIEQIFFNLKGDFSTSSEVKIVGSIPELGNWDINHAPVMDAAQGCCSLDLPVEDLKTFEYKYVQIDDTDEKWEQGPNRQFSPGTELKVNDQWR